MLNEGDEILEINNEPVRGKNVNEVVDLLRELEGTLTFVLIPCTQPPKEPNDETVVMKALFDYDPTNDDMLPCEELGLNFRKGDVLEILNQNDPDWWQVYVHSIYVLLCIDNFLRLMVMISTVKDM